MGSTSSSSWMRSEYKEIILYVFIGVVSLLIPLFWGLVGLGFEESFVPGLAIAFGSYLANTLIYVVFTVIGLFLILFPIARLVSLRRGEHPATARPVSWWRIFTVSPIYAPEENGWLWHLSEKFGFKGKKNFMRWTLNPLRVIVVSALFFGLFGLAQIAIPQLTISGTPQIQLQQITAASEVIFSSLLPAFSENGVLLFTYALIMGIVAFMTAKFKLGKDAFFAIGFLVCILMGFTWGGFHSIVYGNSDVAFWSTVLFGFLGTFMTLLTGIFIFFWIFHLFNNAFFTLGQVVAAREDALFIAGIIWVVVAIIYIGVEVLVKKKKNASVSIPGK